MRCERVVSKIVTVKSLFKKSNLLCGTGIDPIFMKRWILIKTTTGNIWNIPIVCSKPVKTLLLSNSKLYIVLKLVASVTV
jgi:hypothetical protein